MSITQSVQPTLPDFIVMITADPFLATAVAAAVLALALALALFSPCFQFILDLCFANKV